MTSSPPAPRSAHPGRLPTLPPGRGHPQALELPGHRRSKGRSLLVCPVRCESGHFVWLGAGAPLDPGLGRLWAERLQQVRGLLLAWDRPVPARRDGRCLSVRRALLDASHTLS